MRRLTAICTLTLSLLFPQTSQASSLMWKLTRDIMFYNMSGTETCTSVLFPLPSGKQPRARLLRQVPSFLFPGRVLVLLGTAQKIQKKIDWDCSAFVIASPLAPQGVVFLDLLEKWILGRYYFASVFYFPLEK